MTATVFDELRRYARFEAADEASLRAAAPTVAPHFARIVDELYARSLEHQAAFRVFTSAEQVESHKRAVIDWFGSFFHGPWNDAYYERSARIGRVHVEIALPQRFMFGAMSLVRTALSEIVVRERAAPEREGMLRAIHKLLDLELAIMLESYREAHVEQIQRHARLERDDLQRRLAVSEARYGEIVEKGEALITIMDRTGRVQLINDKCERLTGISRAAAQGASWFELFVPPTDRDAVRERCDRALCGRVASAYEGELPTTVASGTVRVRWHFTTLPDGDEPELCAIGIDVSYEYELGIRTRRAERMAALGTITAGLAHEIRNPLNAAHLQLSLAERRLERGDPDIETTKAAVSTASSELERLSLLVQEFLEFARPQALQLAKIDLQHVLETSASELNRDASKRGVSLHVAPGAALHVEADQDKLTQAVLNLVRNALEVVSRGGRVELSADARESSVELTVRDDGPGVPKDLPIFEPFFTTKENGTGMGLAIVHRIAMDHGGQVAVQSVPGDTRFTVSLPRARDS